MEKLKEDKRRLFFCGDIHGDFREFVWTATQKHKISNADIIILGDFGVGFDNSLTNEYKHVESRLKENNLCIWTLRGNHDDPAFFTDIDKFSYPLLKFMEDHKVYNICEREIYIIGGANSTDITWRLEANQKLASKGKDRKVWWKEEDIIKKYDNLPDKVDIICSHSAPICFDPVITRFPETPEYQYKKILEERNYLQYALENIKSDYWFYGHFHNHLSGEYCGLLYRGLGIMEFFEYADTK